MEASAHTPAAQALPHMARTPEPSPATAVSSDTADARAAARTRMRDQVSENPLMTLFGTVLVALLMFNFTTTHSRIGDTNGSVVRLEDRVTRLEESVGARFQAQNAKIDALFEAQNAKMDRLFEAQNAKIERLLAAQDAKMDRLLAAQDAKMERLLAAQDAKMERLLAARDAKIDEINLKLTGLIAAFNATAEVDAALEGKLLDPNEPEAAD